MLGSNVSPGSRALRPLERWREHTSGRLQCEHHAAKCPSLSGGLCRRLGQQESTRRALADAKMATSPPTRDRDDAVTTRSWLKFIRTERSNPRTGRPGQHRSTLLQPVDDGMRLV